MKRVIVAAVAVLMLAGCQKPVAPAATESHAVSGEVHVGALDLTDYAMRAALGNNSATAAYVTIRNGGTADDTLLSASCACAAKASLHTMTMKDGVMDMAEKPEGFVIHAGETLVFAPGGNHIMLQDLTTRPADGTTEAVTLVFQKAGPVTVQMPVSNTPLADKKTDMAGMKM